MKNFLISSIVNLLLIFIFFYLFKFILPGPVRHKLYEKYMSSFAKFVIYIFAISMILNCVLSIVIYRLHYVAYINIIIPCIVSVFVGFIAATVPVKGVDLNDKKI